MAKKKESPSESKAERFARLKARDAKDVAPAHNKHGAKEKEKEAVKVESENAND